MDMRLYSVFDAVAGEAGPVFCAVNDQVALRNLRTLLKDVPDFDRDAYKLYYLGLYDTVTMAVSGSETPCNVPIVWPVKG